MPYLVCKMVGMISVPTIQYASVTVCAASANPVVCRAAAAIKFVTDRPSVSDWIEKGVENGCNWSVKKTGNIIKITIEGTKQAVDNATRELERNIYRLYFQPYPI